MQCSATEDIPITIEPQNPGVYALAPFPFAPSSAEFAFAGRTITPQTGEEEGGWPQALKTAPTRWERFTLVRA